MTTKEPEPVDFDQQAERALLEEQGQARGRPSRTAKVRAGDIGDEWVFDDEDA